MIVHTNYCLGGICSCELGSHEKKFHVRSAVGLVGDVSSKTDAIIIIPPTKDVPALLHACYFSRLLVLEGLRKAVAGRRDDGETVEQWRYDMST